MNGEVSMKKKALLAVLMAMTLLLSSCALIKKDAAVDAATVILTMGDKQVTKAEVQEQVQNVLAEMSQYYAMYGSTLDITDPEILASAQNTAVTRMKQDMALHAKAVELGLDQLTEEEAAKVKEDAESSWESAKSYVQNYYLDEEQKALEGEELDKAILAKLDELGVKFEDYETQAKDLAVDNKLREYVVKDVAVTDEEVKADYDSKVAADEEKYKEDAPSWVSAARNGSTLYYTPAGVRRVKQILLKFKADDQTAIDDVNKRISEAQSKVNAAQQILDDAEAPEEDKTKAEADKAAAQAELDTANADLKAATDKAFENLDADADAVLAALDADPDSWDKLMEEKNEDPGMKAGAVNAEKGYPVCEGMTGFDTAFVDAALALKSVGEHSGKVRGETYGYYIIRYNSDETEGPADFESVKESISSSLLTTKQNEAYTAAVEQWVSEAGIKENLGALKD